MKKNKYLTIEGTDGSGKTTLVKNLMRWFQQENIRVLLTKEFGSDQDKFCQSLRKLALSSEFKVDELAGQLAFAAIVRQHQQKVILPALVNKEIDLILSDRGVDSNYAYAPAHGLKDKAIKNLFALAYEDAVMPDLTIYLDIDPLLSLSRRAKRAKEEFANQGSDRVEDKGTILQQKVRQNFINLIKKHPDRIKLVKVTAEKSPEILLDEVKKIIKQHKIV